MPFQFNINIFSTRKDYTFYAEKLVSHSTEKRFKVYSQERAFIIKKDLVINNSPWELVQGSWPGITRADFMDAIRQMGAGIERVGY